MLYLADAKMEYATDSDDSEGDVASKNNWYEVPVAPGTKFSQT